MVRMALLALFASIGLLEAYCLVEGHVTCVVLLDMLNDYVTHLHCEAKRWDR